VAARNRPASVHLRLYVAGMAPNSVRALRNVQAICTESIPGPCKLEIVDVLAEPRQALAEGILVTPTLIKLSPAPICTIAGNLDDRRALLCALGLEGGAR
jgi:circadian clock protein KaiB